MLMAIWVCFPGLTSVSLHTWKMGWSNPWNQNIGTLAIHLSENHLMGLWAGRAVVFSKKKRNLSGLRLKSQRKDVDFSIYLRQHWLLLQPERRKFAWRASGPCDFHEPLQLPTVGKGHWTQREKLVCLYYWTCCSHKSRNSLTEAINYQYRNQHATKKHKKLSFAVKRIAEDISSTMIIPI